MGNSFFYLGEQELFAGQSFIKNDGGRSNLELYIFIVLVHPINLISLWLQLRSS